MFRITTLSALALLCFTHGLATADELRLGKYSGTPRKLERVRIAAAAVMPEKWDRQTNWGRIEKAVRQAVAEHEAQVVVTPEGVLDGYVINEVNREKDPARRRQLVERFRALAEPIDGPYIRKARDLCRELRVWLVLGFLEKRGNDLYNSAILVDGEGDIVARYSKTHFAQGYTINPACYRPGDEYPVFDTPFGKVAFLICYDRQLPEPARILALQGARVLFLPSYGSYTDRDGWNTVLLRARAYENRLPLVFAHPRQSLLIDHGGGIRAMGKEGEITTFDVDTSDRPYQGRFRNRRPATYSRLAAMPEPLPEGSPAARRDRAAAGPWVVYEGSDGPGKGKHVVLVSGDEEYRSEEGLPQLGKILARHHGFKCTVLFAIDPETGAIDPDNTRNIPGLAALESADLMVIATRFRDLPDEQMKHVAAYLDAGKPVLGMRAAVVAFRLSSPTYERFSCRSRTWKGGFGQQILGQTWISHHGRHGRESTRGLIVPEAKSHPIVRGCEDVWGPTDVYTVRSSLSEDSEVLMLGQVLKGMRSSDKPLEGPKNEPMMPIAWTRSYRGVDGSVGRVFTTTMGAATDFESEGLRRLFVNATYWCVGLAGKIPAKANVNTVGDYKPLPFGFGKFKKGVKPSDHAFDTSGEASEH